MSNLTIKLRLYLLIGLLTAIFIFIGIFTTISINKFIDINHAELMAMEIEVSTLKLRKHEKDFLARDVVSSEFFETGKSKYVRKHNNDLNLAVLYIDSFKIGDYYIRAGVEDDVKKFKEYFFNYKELFSKVVEERKKLGYKDYG